MRVRKIRFPEIPSGAMISPHLSTASSIRISQCSASPSRATSSASAILASTWLCLPISPSLPPESTPTFGKRPNFFAIRRPFLISSSFSGTVHPSSTPTGVRRNFLPFTVSKRAIRSRWETPSAFFNARSVVFAGSVPRTAASILPATRSSMSACSGFACSTI